MRKWNKLLALVLAMVMVFGLTATAFAADDDKAEDTTPTETTEPAEGEDSATPADDETAAPADDETAAPADDEDAAPADDEDAAPADGEDAAPADDEEPAADPYADVSSWAKEAVAAVVEQKLMTAGADGFDPKAPMTRADLVVALYVLAGSPANAEDAENPFPDVADDAACKDAVIWAKDNEIVSGRTNGNFDPDGSVSRQEIAKILFEYAKAENVEEDNLSVFTDVDEIAAWAKDYVNWAVASKLISGNAAEQNTVKMDPNGTATREQVALILVRYINEVLPATTPADGAETPAEDAEAPAEDAETPAEDAETPAEDAEAPAEDAEAPADDADKADDAADKADDAADKADDKAAE